MPDLAGRKTIYYTFTGPIDSAAASRLAAAFNHASNEAYDEVYLAFSSLGGHVADGVFLYNLIRGLPQDVTIHNIGSVCSIAAAIYVAANTRICSSHSIFMVHPTVLPISDHMNVERLQASLDATLADDQRTENILRERTSIPDEVLAARTVKDVHISPENAVSYELAHRIAELNLPRGVQIIQV